MKKLKIFILLNLFFVLFNSCGTVKDAFSTWKKDNTDEFLVEKKNPLKIPPNYDVLPVPGSGDSITEENKDEKIKELITKNETNENKSNEESGESSKSLEELLLGKIKEN